jgi:hypothetical protein
VKKFRGTCIHTVCNKREGIGGLRQINTYHQVPLLVNFFEKPTLRFGVFIVSPCFALTIIGWSYRQGRKNFKKISVAVGHLFIQNNELSKVLTFTCEI